MVVVVVVVAGEMSLGGEPPEARARSAGGLYLPIMPSPCISRALSTTVNDGHHKKKRRESTHLFAKAAEGAGGGVFPEGVLEKPAGSADRDIITLETNRD